MNGFPEFLLAAAYVSMTVFIWRRLLEHWSGRRSIKAPVPQWWRFGAALWQRSERLPLAGTLLLSLVAVLFVLRWIMPDDSWSEFVDSTTWETAKVGVSIGFILLVLCLLIIGRPRSMIPPQSRPARGDPRSDADGAERS
jgi:hypothetical protein